MRLKKIQVKNFEGPLDLLLELIESKKLDIAEISLAEVTEQYLNFFPVFQEKSFEELAEFLDIATRLIFIKSYSILAVLDEKPYEEESDLLKKRLEIYQFYRYLSKKLSRDLVKPPFLYSRGVFLGVREQFNPGKNLNLTNLSGSLLNIIKGFESEKAKIPSSRLKATITSEEALEKILKKLNKKGVFRLNPSRFKFQKEKMAVYFLSVLELMRRGSVRIFQKNPFGILKIRPTAQFFL